MSVAGQVCSIEHPTAQPVTDHGFVVNEPSRTKTWLLDALGGIAVIWAIPLAIVLVGAPIGLAIAALRWLVRQAF